MYVFVLLLYVNCVCKFFFVDSVYCYLFCLCVVLCSFGQGRTAVADCIEVKFINQIKVKSQDRILVGQRSSIDFVECIPQLILLQTAV